MRDVRERFTERFREAGAGDETAARIHVFGAASLNSHRNTAVQHGDWPRRGIFHDRAIISPLVRTPPSPLPLPSSLLQAAYVSVALHFPRNCPGNACSPSCGMRDAHREHSRAVSWMRSLNFHRAALPCLSNSAASSSLLLSGRVTNSQIRTFAGFKALYLAYELRTS